MFMNHSSEIIGCVPVDTLVLKKVFYLLAANGFEKDISNGKY